MQNSPSEDTRPDWITIHNKVKRHIRALPKVSVSGDVQRAFASVPRLADELGIDKNTARAHLRAMLEKDINGTPVSVKMDGMEIYILDPPLRGEESSRFLNRTLSVVEGSFGTFLLCNSWKRKDQDWTKTLEVVAGISLLTDGGIRALTDKGMFEHLFGLISENWG